MYKRQIQWAQSFDVGVARLHMLMNWGDPLGEEGLAKMQPYLNDVLTPLSAAMDALKPSKLVGASGSFDTLADLAGTRARRERPDHAQSPEPHPGIDPIPLDSWTELCRQLTTCDVHHRAAMPGMDPARVDLMPYLSLIHI